MIVPLKKPIRTSIYVMFVTQYRIPFLSIIVIAPDWIEYQNGNTTALKKSTTIASNNSSLSFKNTIEYWYQNNFYKYTCLRNKELSDSYMYMYHANLVVLKTRNLLKLTDGLKTTHSLSKPVCVCVCACVSVRTL